MKEVHCRESLWSWKTDFAHRNVKISISSGDTNPGGEARSWSLWYDWFMLSLRTAQYVLIFIKEKQFRLRHSLSYIICYSTLVICFMVQTLRCVEDMQTKLRLSLGHHTIHLPWTEISYPCAYKKDSTTKYRYIYWLNEGHATISLNQYLVRFMSPYILCHTGTFFIFYQLIVAMTTTRTDYMASARFKKKTVGK